MTDKNLLKNEKTPIHNLIANNQTYQATQFNRRRFLQTASLASLSAGLIGCGNNNDNNAALFKPMQVNVDFLHGVASGDPLSDKVILWTRITPKNNASITAEVNWQIATDKDFSHIINQGKSTATAGKDYTVKVDATGLQPNTVYYYRFIVDQAISPAGRTKTLPIGNVNQVKFAVFSCSNYPAGYFHAYADAAKHNDIDVALHLGDYIYEYGRTTVDNTGATVPAYASASAKSLNREVTPANELLSISDYRQRYAQYRTDPELQQLHATMPMIAVWDDHEIANDAYIDGAENHQTNEGNWNERKLSAITAYHEWMPTRTNAPNQIYRSFDFGNLLSLHMLDTRIVGRSKQLDYQQFLTPNSNGQMTIDGQKFATAMSDASRQLIGLPQQNWLFQQLQQSTATWQILGQQVVMGRMSIPAPILLNFFNPKLGVDVPTYFAIAQKAQQIPAILSEQEKAIIQAPSIPYNLDSWDGYPIAREAVLQMSKHLQKNLVVLSGDTHNAWANELTLQSGENVGVEFAGTSVTSPGFEAYLPNVNPLQLAQALPMLVKDKTLKWCDTHQRGYLVVTVTPTRCQADWVMVDDILKPTYSTMTVKSMYMEAGKPVLQG